jgi:hypothetical protein
MAEKCGTCLAGVLLVTFSLGLWPWWLSLPALAVASAWTLYASVMIEVPAEQ